MIKINLLGQTDQGTSTAVQVLAMASGFLLLCLVVVAYLYISNSKQISALKMEQAALESDLSGLQERTKAVKDLDQKSKTLRNKLSVIAKLKKSKTGPVRVMDDLNTATPPKVWLREVKESNGTVKIKGRALNNQHIATLMQNLQKSEYFDQVDLVESRQMYYSRSTGKVTPMTDITRLKTADFSRDSRVTKQSANNLGSNKPALVIKDTKSRSDTSSRNRVEEENVNVNEFVLSAKIFYAGKPANLEQQKQPIKK